LVTAPTSAPVTAVTGTGDPPPSPPRSDRQRPSERRWHRVKSATPAKTPHGGWSFLAPPAPRQLSLQSRDAAGPLSRRRARRH